MLTTLTNFTIDDVAASVGIKTLPASWRRHWDAYSFKLDRGETVDIDWSVPPDAVVVFDLPTESLAPLSAAMKQIDADDTLKQLGAFWHFMVYELDDEIGESSNLWALPDHFNGVQTKLFSLAVLVAGTHRAIANNAASGMSDDVSRASLAFIGRRVREVRDKRKAWGVESLSFLRHYVRGELFRLGRLTFRVSPAPVASFPQLDAKDLRIEVHIAGGASLDSQAVRSSYRQAIERLQGRWVPRPIVGFTCISWLLDPALKSMLSAESNILKFAEPFQIASVSGDRRQAYDLIFGDPDVDLSTFSPRSTLQAAVIRHAASGGAIRFFAGFMPWDDAVRRYGS